MIPSLSEDMGEDMYICAYKVISQGHCLPANIPQYSKEVQVWIEISLLSAEECSHSIMQPCLLLSLLAILSSYLKPLVLKPNHQLFDLKE